jgi:hypothetical protein
MKNKKWRKQRNMRKILLSLLLVGVIFSCGQKEESSSKNTESSTTESTESNSGAPKFKDPEVQKFADAYAELSKEYDNMTPEKAAELSQKFQDLSSKSQEITQKLASDPEEAQKFTDYMMEIGEEIQEKMKK